jgi:putative transcriptional regulator
MAEMCDMRIPKRETVHQSLEGQLLVASMQMDDPRFAKSVVLLLHHDEQSAMGIVLNKPLPEKPKAALKKLFGGSEETRDFFAGGPVSGPVIAIALAFHEVSDLPQTGSVMIIKEPKQLDELTQVPHDNLLVFIGHAGWGAGQLEEELKRGDWHSLPARVDLLFGQDREIMWEAAIEEIGLEFYRSALGIVDFPADVTAN